MKTDFDQSSFMLESFFTRVELEDRDDARECRVQMAAQVQQVWDPVWEQLFQLPWDVRERAKK